METLISALLGGRGWPRGRVSVPGRVEGKLRRVTTQTVPAHPPPLQPKPSAPHLGLEATLQERLALYQSAIESARQAGDSAKTRRYDRGLKVSGRAGLGQAPAPGSGP